MKTVYRVLAFLIAALVIVQAAAIAFGVFGLFAWVDQGGTVDKALTESDAINNVGGIAGFMLHGMLGTIVIPIVAVVFVIVSFFAKVLGGVKFALYTFGAVVVQVALGIFSHELAALGWLHGAWALVLFGLATMAAVRVRWAGASPARARYESAAPTTVSG